MDFGVFCQDVRMQTSLLSIKHLVGEAQCYEAIRQLRWQKGVACPHCDSRETIRRGFYGPDRHPRRYECKPRGRRLLSALLEGLLKKTPKPI